MLSGQGRFPKPIPPAVEVPSWAYLNITVSDIFDPVAAQANITHALATSTAAPSSSSATSTISTNMPSSQASTSSRSNAGAIAGGVVGGIVFLAGVALGAIWFLLRRRGWKNRVVNRRPVNLDEDDACVPPLPTEGYASNHTVTSPISSGPTPYVHSRETSDVGSMVTSAVYTTFGGQHSTDSLPYNPSQAPRGYSGAAEI